MVCVATGNVDVGLLGSGFAAGTMKLMFERGKMYHRQRELHDRFGGNRQSGIAPCASHPYILLFSSPRGEDFGYRDGWAGRAG